MTAIDSIRRPLTIAFLIASVVLVMPEPLATYAILAAIVIGGMPHGGLDLMLARHRFGLDTAPAAAAFLASYLFVAACVIAVWSVAPTAALVLFLAYSALHFGGDLAENGAVGALLAGLFVLGLPAITDHASTAAIFSELGAEGAPVATSLAVAGVISAIATAFRNRDRMTILGIMAALAALSWIAPPLVYFFVYFCGIHAPWHVRRVASECRMPTGALLRQSLMLALLAALAMAAAALFLFPRIGWTDALLRAVFVGFAALTVPHMLLVDLGPTLARALERKVS